MTKPYFTLVEEIIAKGRLAIIAALEGKFVPISGNNYARIANGKFTSDRNLPQIALIQCENDTLERYLRTSVPLVELAQPESQIESEALDWFIELPPEIRTIQLSRLYEQTLQEVS